MFLKLCLIVIPELHCWSDKTRHNCAKIWTKLDMSCRVIINGLPVRTELVSLVTDYNTAPGHIYNIQHGKQYNDLY